jgi:hypothetical protein
MFLENKYSKCYYNIITRAKSRTYSNDFYTEKHHILPTSLGGSTGKSNLVKLTAREHYICHLLLMKFTIGEAYIKMTFAAAMMSNIKNTHQQNRYVPKSKLYEKVKLEAAKAMSIKNTGRSISDDQKNKISLANTGRKTGRTKDSFTTTWKENISKSKKGSTAWNKGIPRTDEVKQAVSNANKGRVPWNKGVKNFKNLNKV